MKVFQQIVKNLAAISYYNNDQYGIIRRYLAEGQNWNLHLENCKKYILKSLPEKAMNSIAILGSGWLLDVPIDELMLRSNKVVLYDINHPKQVINKYGKFKNISFIKADLTNNLIHYAKQSRSFDEFLEIFNNSKPTHVFKQYDYVVSINLLNQLDILLCDFLKKKFNVHDENLLILRETIQRQHLEALPKGRTCIISDYEEINYFKTLGDGNKQSLVYTNVSNLAKRQEWLWTFDTRKTYHKNYNTTFKVFAGIF